MNQHIKGAAAVICAASLLFCSSCSTINHLSTVRAEMVVEEEKAFVGAAWTVPLDPQRYDKEVGILEAANKDKAGLSVAMIKDAALIWGANYLRKYIDKEINKDKKDNSDDKINGVTIINNYYYGKPETTIED